VSFQPLEGLAKAQALEVHDQVDGAAAPVVEVPVDELGSSDRERAMRGVPLVGIGAVGHRAHTLQDRGQGNGAQPVGSGLPGLWVARQAGQASGESLSRKVMHSRRLKTWLVSVSRSMRAAVR